MEDRKPINPDDNDLYLGYDNLAIDKSDSKPLNAKLIVVQPKSIEPENKTVLQTDNIFQEPNSPSRLSSSSDSIEELDIGYGRSANIDLVEYVTDQQESEEIEIEKINQINKNTNIFDEEILASDLVRNPDPKFPLVDIRSDLKRFLLTPPPKGVLFRCQINKTNNIDKTLYFTNLIFSLQSCDKKSNVSTSLDVLMVAYPNRNPKKFSYSIFSDPSEINVNSQYLVGQLQSNFLGTRFNIYSKADSPILHNSSESDNDEADQDMNMNKDRNHIGVVFFKMKRMGSGKPRKIDVAIPNWDNNKGKYCDTSLPPERNKLDENQDKNYTKLSNVEPLYDKELKCYILNFGGRAEEISVKNFALKMKIGDRDKRVYQFGKCKKHYIVDFTYPICALQAFAISLSVCQRRLAPE